MAEAPSQMRVCKTVCVWNLPEKYFDEDDLLNCFLQHTDFVHMVEIIRNVHTKECRGFGTIVVSEDDAEKLINLSSVKYEYYNLYIMRALEEQPFQMKLIPTPGYNCYKRPPLPEFVSYEENEPSKPTIHSLNDDALNAIFKYLKFKELIGIERVCRRWQFLIYERYRGMSWCFINDDVGSSTPVKYFEKDLVPRFPTQDSRCDFTGLSADQSENWTKTFKKQVVDKILQVVGENLPNLCLSRFKGSYSESRALAQLAPNLQTLCLRGTATGLDNLFPITETCKNLTHLFLNGILMHEDITMAITKCHKLETLSAFVLEISLLSKLPKTIKNLQVQLVEHIHDDIVQNIQHLEDLERLSVHRDKQYFLFIKDFYSLEMERFSSRQVKGLSENHKNLKFLRCLSLGEEVDYSVLTSLEHLHLEGSCPLSLFNNLPPKLKVLGIFPAERRVGSPYSLDLSCKLPSSLHSLLVHYQYLDLKSLLTLEDVPSVKKLVLFVYEFYSNDDSSFKHLESLVTIPNLRELFFNHTDIDEINHLQFNKISEIRKNSVSKVKKNDSNLHQEKLPLLLYGNFDFERKSEGDDDEMEWDSESDSDELEWKPENDDVKLLSISKPMLDGVVFPYEIKPEDDDYESVDDMGGDFGDFYGD